jgi:CpeS-like protein
MKLQQAKQQEEMAVSFLQRSAGQWNSQRRYYTLKEDSSTEQMVSHLKISFLEMGDAKLEELAKAHGLAQKLKAGSSVFWESKKEDGKIISRGTTILGVLGNILYRDRGFATPKPVFAHYRCAESTNMALRTEYNGSVFEEEFKLIGKIYRTRQTIISRAGEELMIGQYLERRLE